MVCGKMLAALLCGAAALESEDQVTMIQRVKEPSLEPESDPAPSDIDGGSERRIMTLEDRYGFRVPPFPGRQPEEFEGLDEETKAFFRKAKAEYEAPYKVLTDFSCNYTQLTAARVNSTKWFFKDFLLNHGPTIAKMYKRPNEGGFAQASDAEASQSRCNEQDKMSMLSKLMSTTMEGDHEECAVDDILTPNGLHLEKLSRCIQASIGISQPCSQCFVDLAAVATGTPQNPACAFSCVMQSVWCQDGPTRVCFRKISDCFQCTADHMATLATCTGMDAQKAFKRAYNEFPELIFYGNITEAGILQIPLAKAAVEA